MVQRVDYYALLSRAVGELAPDAYAARGAIYDREHKALLRRLIGASASDEDLAHEEQAFRAAIRRIEFPGDNVPPRRGSQREPAEEVSAPRGPQRQPAEAAWPSSSRDRVRAQRREMLVEPQPQDLDAERRGQRRDSASPQVAGERHAGPPPLPHPESGRGQTEPAPRRRSMLRLTAAYLAVTALVLGVGTLGYAYLVGAVNVSWLNQWTWVTEWSGVAAPSSSARAVMYAVDPPSPNRTRVEGKAIWGSRTEPSGADGKPDAVATLDVEIPEPHLTLSMVLSRNLEAGAGMSHLIELSFAKPQELPFGGISKIASISTPATETEGGDVLDGTSVDIAPGQFMFGLLGLPDVVQQNIQRLRSPGWLAIGIVFASGATYTLEVEKGSAGERVINDVLTKWGQ